jgi:hypothetical protein
MRGPQGIFPAPSVFVYILLSKRDFLVALMENPNLLEHESFTDLLWAVFHLVEELAVRLNPFDPDASPGIR